MEAVIPEWFETKINEWLMEDIPYLDPAASVFQKDLEVKAVATAKGDGILAGIPFVKKIYSHVGVQFEALKNDGDRVEKGDLIYQVKGAIGPVLRAERLALNILTHLSGVATMTNRAATILKSKNVKTKVAATRKTLPGLRMLQKYAVIIGGGYPHRFGLSEVVMIKDNHLEFIGDLEIAIKKIRERFGPQVIIEVEAKTLEEGINAAKKGANIVMLDNFNPVNAKKAAGEIKKKFPKVIIEASGGINLENIQEYADDNIDYVSMGALTHSVKPLDISCKIKRE